MALSIRPELAEYHWQHRDDKLGEEVELDVAKPLRVTTSFRLPAGDVAVGVDQGLFEVNRDL